MTTRVAPVSVEAELETPVPVELIAEVITFRKLTMLAAARAKAR
jgi:hypothetical protein